MRWKCCFRWSCCCLFFRTPRGKRHHRMRVLLIWYLIVFADTVAGFILSFVALSFLFNMLGDIKTRVEDMGTLLAFYADIIRQIRIFFSSLDALQELISLFPVIDPYLSEHSQQWDFACYFMDRRCNLILCQCDYSPHLWRCCWSDRQRGGSLWKHYSCHWIRCRHFFKYHFTCLLSRLFVPVRKTYPSIHEEFQSHLWLWIFCVKKRKMCQSNPRIGLVIGLISIFIGLALLFAGAGILCTNKSSLQ